MWLPHVMNETLPLGGLQQPFGDALLDVPNAASLAGDMTTNHFSSGLRVDGPGYAVHELAAVACGRHACRRRLANVWTVSLS